MLTLYYFCSPIWKSNGNQLTAFTTLFYWDSDTNKLSAKNIFMKLSYFMPYSLTINRFEKMEHVGRSLQII